MEPRHTHYPFADRMKGMKPSCIREMLKAAATPGFISFAGGLPDPTTFPVPQLIAAAQRVMVRNPTSALQYGVAEGDIRLRQWVVDRALAMRGIQTSVDDVIITHGSQQALDLIGKVFLNRNDTIIVESPTYLSAIHAFTMFEPRFFGIPMQTDGIDADALATALQHCNAPIAYLIPNFQNPSGTLYSEANRQRVAEALRESSTILIEDDPYRDLYFDTEPPPSIASYIPERSVCIGSFSKILAPGFRLGWVYAPKALLKKLIIARQAADLCPSSYTQFIAGEFLTSPDFEQHLVQTRTLYRKKRDMMMDLLQKTLPDATIIQPRGGMFIWVALAITMSTSVLMEKLIPRGIAIAPGRPFFPDGVNDYCMRLNFTNADEESMRRGVSVMAEVVHGK
jgi:2-aminoadipate transaminase